MFVNGLTLSLCFSGWRQIPRWCKSSVHQNIFRLMTVNLFQIAYILLTWMRSVLLVLLQVIAHEISHSWTGNLVTNKTWEHFWSVRHTEYANQNMQKSCNDWSMLCSTLNFLFLKWSERFCFLWYDPCNKWSLSLQVEWGSYCVHWENDCQVYGEWTAQAV